MRHGPELLCWGTICGQGVLVPVKAPRTARGQPQLLPADVELDAVPLRYPAAGAARAPEQLVAGPVPAPVAAPVPAPAPAAETEAASPEVVFSSGRCNRCDPKLIVGVLKATLADGTAFVADLKHEWGAWVLGDIGATRETRHVSTCMASCWDFGAILGAHLDDRGLAHVNSWRQDHFISLWHELRDALAHTEWPPEGWVTPDSSELLRQWPSDCELRTQYTRLCANIRNLLSAPKHREACHRVTSYIVVRLRRRQATTPHQCSAPFRLRHLHGSRQRRLPRADRERRVRYIRQCPPGGAPFRGGLSVLNSAFEGCVGKRFACPCPVYFRRLPSGPLASLGNLWGLSGRFDGCFMSGLGWSAGGWGYSHDVLVNRSDH